MLIIPPCFPYYPSPIFLNGIHIQTKKDHTHLGITLSKKYAMNISY